MYNEAIQSAHNWRLNFDSKAELVNILVDKLNQTRRLFPLMLIAGVMLGVLGTLLAAQAFTV